MSFEKWVRAYGIRALAKDMGLNESSVQGWLRRRQSPSSRASLKLIRLSKGKLTLEQIVTETLAKGLKL